MIQSTPIMAFAAMQFSAPECRHLKSKTRKGRPKESWCLQPTTYMQKFARKATSIQTFSGCQTQFLQNHEITHNHRAITVPKRIKPVQSKSHLTWRSAGAGQEATSWCERHRCCCHSYGPHLTQSFFSCEVRLLLLVMVEIELEEKLEKVDGKG